MSEIRVYDADEAAAILRCKPSWLREKARRREIPHTVIGGSYRWTSDHLAAIVRLGERVPPSAAASTRRRRTSATQEAGQLLRARPPRRPRGPTDVSAA